MALVNLDTAFKDYGLVQSLPDGEAFVDGGTGLLEDVVYVSRRIHKLPRLERRPASIGIAVNHRSFRN